MLTCTSWPSGPWAPAMLHQDTRDTQTSALFGLLGACLPSCPLGLFCARVTAIRYARGDVWIKPFAFYIHILGMFCESCSVFWVFVYTESSATCSSASTINALQRYSSVFIITPTVCITAWCQIEYQSGAFYCQHEPSAAVTLPWPGTDCHRASWLQVWCWQLPFKPFALRAWEGLCSAPVSLLLQWLIPSDSVFCKDSSQRNLLKISFPSSPSTQSPRETSAPF